MEKDAAGYPSLPLHYGLMNPGTSRTSPAAYPTSRAVLRGGGGGDVTSLPDTWVGNHPGLPGPEFPQVLVSCGGRCRHGWSSNEPGPFYHYFLGLSHRLSVLEVFP